MEKMYRYGFRWFTSYGDLLDGLIDMCAVMGFNEWVNKKYLPHELIDIFEKVGYQAGMQALDARYTHYVEQACSKLLANGEIKIIWGVRNHPFYFRQLTAAQTYVRIGVVVWADYHEHMFGQIF